MMDRPLGATGFSTGFGYESGKVYRMTLPDDPEAASMMSLDAIHAIAREGREDPRVRRKAFQIIRRAGVTDGRQTPQIIKSIFDWIQRHVFYMHDPSGVEFLTTPGELIVQADNGEAVEDCDSFVALAHALYNVVGRPTRSVIWKADRRAPDQWSHITLEVHDGQRWVPLDPIMKDKPLGWSPPTYFQKRVVPIPDGEPWPNGRPQSVAPVDARPPTGAARHTESMKGFFGGSVNAITWRGFGRYGDRAMEEHLYQKLNVMPAFPACHDITNPTTLVQTLRLEAARNELAAAGIRPQNRDPMEWFGHMDGILYQEYDQSRPFPMMESRGYPRDLLWAQAKLRKYALYLKRMGDAGVVVAERFERAATDMQTCFEQRRDYGKTLLPYRELGKILGEIKELKGMRDEAVTYLAPLIAAVDPLMERAAKMTGRLEERQEFLEIVNEVVQVVGIVLSALGAVTAGITELINIVIQLGNMAYQMRQMAKMATGSSAKTLNEVASALTGIEVYANAALNVAEAADSQIAQREQLINLAREKHPEWFPSAEAITAELQSMPDQPKKSALPVVLGVSAAAGLLAMVAL